MIKTFNLTVKFSKFTLNIKIYKKFEEFLFKIVWRETLFEEDACDKLISI